MKPEPSVVEWRPVVGYEGLYEVSEVGDVRRVAGTYYWSTARLVKQAPNGPGKYLAVHLSKQSKAKRVYVHILVAEAFLGVLPRGQGSDDFQVDHVDGNKYNNDWRNLEYISTKENLARAGKLQLLAWGEKHPRAKLTAEQVRQIRQVSGRGSAAALGRLFGVKPDHARKLQRGDGWKNLV